LFSPQTNPFAIIQAKLEPPQTQNLVVPTEIS